MNRSHTPAFTLIELLVVIAIIGILAAILLPTLTKSKSKAAQMIDLSNLGQLSLSSVMYATDNHDSEPGACWGDTKAGWLFGDNFPVNTASGNLAGAAAVYSSQIQSLMKGQLWAFIKNPKVYVCPLDFTNNVLWAARGCLVTSYAVNGAICGYGTQPDGKSYKLSQFTADDVEFMEPSEYFPFDFNDGANHPYEGITQRHLGKTGVAHTASEYGYEDLAGYGTVGCFGGSAMSMSYARFYALAGNLSTYQSIRPLPNALWCNPGTANGQ